MIKIAKPPKRKSGTETPAFTLNTKSNITVIVIAEYFSIEKILFMSSTLVKAK